MDRKQLITKYIEFFKSKNHKQIENASLIPQNDPTVLFTTAGMHPLVPYLTNQNHPSGKRLVNVQKCIRTQDIEEVGDQTHHTFFEMLGNWSLGDYWKIEAFSYTLEFLTKVLNIPIEKLAISCFKGDNIAKKDIESAEIWKSLGIPKERIAFLGKKDNWWGPAGEIGPCGPDTEIFYWNSKSKPQKSFNTKDKNWVEIGNNVLMQYEKTNNSFKEAKNKIIDFGGGVERLVLTLSNLEDDYLTPHFLPIIKQIEKTSGKTYNGNKKEMRIIADHIKASVFILADNITPSNMEQGYVLRRLIRRSIRYARKLNLKNFTKEIALPVFDIYNDYNHLKNNKLLILNELEKEELRFLETLEKGLKAFEKLTKDKKKLSGKQAFFLYQSYGFPIEMTQEISKEKNIHIDLIEFNKENKKHQQLSRTAKKGKFSSGLADSSKETTRLHTATHLLHAALRKVLGDKVTQKGSNITKDRLRFDFSFDRKLTENEIKKIEHLINSAIKNKLEVTSEEMSPKQAKLSNALGFFEHKYSDNITVYSIESNKNQFSKEICTGPHVNNTTELGKFKIKKEESSSAGVRRIKAVLLGLK